MPRRFRPYHPDHSPDTEEISAAGESVTFLPQAEIDAASGDTMANHLIDYVRAAGTVAPVIEGRIVRED